MAKKFDEILTQFALHTNEDFFPCDCLRWECLSFVIFFSHLFFFAKRGTERATSLCVCERPWITNTHTPQRFRFVTNFPTIWAIFSPTFHFQIEIDVIFRHLTLQILHVHVFFAKICCSIEAFQHHHQSKNIQREILVISIKKIVISLSGWEHGNFRFPLTVGHVFLTPLRSAWSCKNIWLKLFVK